jgi:hypothetical protein
VTSISRAAQPIPAEVEGRLGILEWPIAVWAALLALLAGTLYWITGPNGSGGDEYIPLANALLHGQILVAARSWVELVPLSGGWAVPFPPAPVLFYLPVVALTDPKSWSDELSVSIMPALVGGASVGLAYLMLRERLHLSQSAGLWITAGFATTTLWWVAGMGGTHHMAQISAVFFSLLALYLALAQRLPVLGGLCFALAVGSRLPVGLSLPLFLYLYRRQWWQFLLGTVPIAVAIAAYNIARFGSPIDFGYARIPSGSDKLVTDEPWYNHGLESVLYIPNGLNTMLLSGFSIRPSWAGASLALTAPFLFWSFTAGGRLAIIAGVSAALVLLVDLMHGNSGFAQFGYRFALDATPILLLLIGLGSQKRLPLGLRPAVVFGAIFTLWGIWAINVLNFVGW